MLVLRLTRGMFAVFSNINYWGLSSWERALDTIPDNDFESVDSNAASHRSRL